MAAEQQIEEPKDDLEEHTISDNVGEDDGDEGDDEEFDDEIVDIAATLGLNPDDYDSAAKLEKACWGEAKKQQDSSNAAALSASPKDDKPTADELALEAYNVELNDDDFNPALRKELQKLSDTQTERFRAVLKELRAEHAKEIAALKDHVKYLGASTAAQAREGDSRRLEKWVRKSDEAKAYFGEGDTDDLDQNGRHARRRRALMNRAYRFQRTYPQDKPSPSADKLFDMAFAATPGGKRKRSAPSADADDRKSPTRTARATGAAKRTDKKPQTQEERLEKGGKRVEEWQRQHGYEI